MPFSDPGSSVAAGNVRNLCAVCQILPGELILSRIIQELRCFAGHQVPSAFVNSTKSDQEGVSLSSCNGHYQFHAVIYKINHFQMSICMQCQLLTQLICLLRDHMHVRFMSLQYYILQILFGSNNAVAESPLLVPPAVASIINYPEYNIL